MNATDDRPQPGAEAPSPPPVAPPPAPAPPPQAYAPQPAPAAPADPRRKSPALACMLSIMPGLGQVYVGYYRLGFIHVIVAAGVIATLNARIPGPMYPLLGIFLGFFCLYNIVDAGRRAAFYNEALAGIGGVELPTEGMSLPTGGGSRAAGVMLILAGAILLSYTRFGISLVWLEDWWPLAPIGFGVWLVARSIMDRAAKE